VTPSRTPLTRNPDVLQQDLDGEVLLLLPGGSAVLHLNDSASALWRALDEPRTLDEVAAMLAETYAADPDVVRADLLALLPDLRACGALLTS